MCRPQSKGGRRCIGYFNDRIDNVTVKLEAATAAVKVAALQRSAYIATVENLKQEKRDIRALAKDEGRPVNAEEKLRIVAINEEMAEVEQIRKDGEDKFKELKWEAGKLATKEHTRKLDRDEKTGTSPVAEYESTRLGTATFTGSFEPNTPEWHELRAKGIGGSDVASIMGTSPFMKEEKLFALKTGQLISDNSEGVSFAMHMGNLYEPIIQRRFAESNSDLKVWNTKGSWKADHDEFQLANIDGLYAKAGEDTPTGVLEIKAVSSDHGWETEPPIYYRQQALWYCDTFGLKEAKFAILINQHEYREYTISAREGEMEEIHAKVDAFKKRVSDYRVEQEKLAA
jgi:putative phage-type endonuclease